MPQQRNGEERSGKDGRPPGGPLAHVKNSPPAPPPAFWENLRRRRRSDVLLALIGAAACLVSLANLAWHSGGLPHSRHVKSGGGGGGKVPELKLRGKSALQAKLDEFVRAKDKGRTMRVRKVPNDDGEGGAGGRPNKGREKNPTNEGTKKRKGKMGRAPKIPTIDDLVAERVRKMQMERPEGNRATKDRAETKSKRQFAASKKGAHDAPPRTVHLNVDPKIPAGKGAPVARQNNVDPKRKSAAKRAQDGRSKKKNDPTIDAKQNADVGKPDSAKPDSGKDGPHPVAHLNCADHGGPTDPKIIDEMVFWSDVPSDASYLSPMHPLNDPRTPDDVERFLTFEPDSGGWNNIRMAMETALVMSHAMGRTLVLPPEQGMYLLDKGGGGHKRQFSFNDFFHLDAISIEHRGFRVITMEEFLVRAAMGGELKDARTGEPAYPPGKRTDWGGGGKATELFRYLRSVGNVPEWESWECALAIPSSTEPEAIAELEATLKSIMDGSYGKPRPTLEEFNGHPTPVNASLAERMREMLADRDNLCIYDKPLQESKLIHLKVENGKKDVRWLTHFYAFIFYADWRQDLWSKRFVRDHLRYVDEIVCAAARVVEAVRGHARKNERYELSREEGVYDAMHVRRGDFQFPPTQLPAEELYALSEGELSQNATLYVATDERDKGFFDVFRKHYDVVFLDDFAGEVIPDVNPNYYGMIDQLVAYKSRVFYGTWWSTLSGYVNRMRGYYIAKHKLEGYKDGTMKSWYFTPPERVLQMRSYIPVRKPIYCREFPISWRDIDVGIEELQ